MRALALACVAFACGNKPAPPDPHAKRDAAPAEPAVAIVELAERPLGLPDLTAFGWRDRAGHPSFREARTAEAAADWPAVVSACKQALAADPGHLEASWLLAAALGRQGKHTELVAPLQTAVAGDFITWSKASLELPALATFRATPAGLAWIRRVETDRDVFAAAIARGTLVIANGDVFSVERDGTRWYRLTRTAGGVIAGLAVPGAKKLAYVARVIPRYGKPTKKRELAIGVIDLAKGTTMRPADLGTVGPITVAYTAKGFAIGSGAPKQTWRLLENDYKLVALPPRTSRPGGPRLDVKARSAHLTALPLAGVVADWDERGLASAIRLGGSNRIVSVPSPGLIDGNTARWSPQKTHLAFVAQLDETCTPGAVSAAAVIADVATGTTRELVRATKGLAVEWISERELVVADDQGVAVYDLDGGAVRRIEGAKKLVSPKKRTKCTDEPEDEPDPEESVEAPDSGVVEPIEGVRNSPHEIR